MIQPRGNSMSPKVKSGAKVYLQPIADPAALTKDDIVLVKVAGKVYLHLVSASDNNRVQISNNRGHINGWVPRTSIYGIATRVEN